MPTIKRTSSFALLGVLGLYWLTRLINIDALALFLDEANHLWWARRVWEGHPFLAAVDGRLLNVLWMAAFYPFNASIWLARVSVVLLTTVGVACLLAMTRRYFSWQAAVGAGLFYIFMPLAFFFDRLALADSLSAPFVALTMWLASVKFARAKTMYWQVLWGMLGGLALTLAILSKISNLIFLCIPVLATLFLFPAAERKKGVLLSSAMYTGCAASLVPIVVFLRVGIGSSLGLNLVSLKTGGALAELPAQIIQTGQAVWYWFSIYLPFPMWVVLVILMAFAIWRGQRQIWFILSVLVVTLGTLIVQTKPAYLASRFLPAYAPLIAIIVGGGLAALTSKWRRLFWIGSCLLLIVPGMLFAGQAWIDPTQLPLGDDHWHYVSGWPSGYGFRAVALDYIQRNEAIQLVTLDLGSSEKLDGYLLGRTTKVTTRWYRGDFPLTGALVVVDATLPGYGLAELKAPATEVARYYRPGQTSPVIVYQVTP